MPDFLLPDLGEGLEEAEVVAWRVQVGERVDVDQVIAEVETAKAAVEVPVPFAGVVAALHAAPGDSVQVGRPLITVNAEAPAAGRAEGFREPGVETGATARSAAGSAAGFATDAGSGRVLIGYGTPAESPRAARRSRRSAGRSAEVGPSAAHDSGPVPVISPLVRKMARDAGLDLRSVAGTGTSGLVRRSDVEQALTRAVAVPAPPDSPGVTRIALRGLRRATAEKLARSRREIPEATVWVDVDATEFVAARRTLNSVVAASGEQPVSLLALLARFVVLGLRRYPELNARIEGDEIVLPEAVHLGFAAQTDRGLVVPVVRDAHRLSTRDLAAALSARTAAARDGTLAPADLTGGTFTVNNYGVFGVDGSAAIINHPEVAILGMGRVIDRPWVVEGQLTVRKVTQLTLAFDHRACDGGTAGGFLRYVADCVESPIAALADL